MIRFSQPPAIFDVNFLEWSKMVKNGQKWSKMVKNNFKLNDDRIIVELKTHYKKDLDQLTKDFPYQRIRFSKYCFGIEKLQLK